MCSNVRRFEFVGSYEKFECGVKIVADVGAVGRWSCFVKEYRNIGPGRDARAEIQISFKQREVKQTDMKIKNQKDVPAKNIIENKTEISRKILPLTIDATTRYPAFKESEPNPDGSPNALVPVFVSVAVLVLVVATVFSLVWVRRKKLSRSREKSMNLISIKRENSRMSFRSN